MAVSWGAWEYSGGNGMRVGIDVSWEAITHGEAAATATIEIWTENQYTYGDSMSLNYGGSISGSTSFNNSAGGSPVKRATKTYTYNYGNNEYGSSPGSRTFSATISGAYNGVTPSKSVSSNIPARPIAAPAAPTNVSASRISDTSTKVSWTNKDTNGEPWSSVNVDIDVGDNNAWANASTSGGGSTSFTDGTAANNKYRWRVRAENSAGNSSWVETGLILTTPNPPTSAVRTNGTGAQQVVSWSNKGGYSEYLTEVQRGVTPAGGGTTTWTTIASSVASGTTSYTDTGASASQATMYRVRHKSNAGVQGTLYSDWSNETTSTPGVTQPPLAPTKLTPNNLTVDPTLKQRLTWQFNPSMIGDTQTVFEVQHRLSGSATWTTATGTTTNYYELPANTYAEEKIIEWQVRTRGADPSFSPYSTPVTFQTAITPIALDAVKVPVEMDLFTGRLEANTNAYEKTDFIRRIQSNVMGGGVRAVSATYALTWSQRFIPISLGRSQRTFPMGHHDIVNPYGWSVNNKSIVVTGGISRATLTVTASTMRIRPGEKISVTAVGAPYDGEWTCRSISSNQVSFDLPDGTAAQSATAATGAVFATILGHGGSGNSYPNASAITLSAWEALYYDPPFGWGGGSTVRKNGLVNVTNKALTSNVATLTIAAGHWFVIGDRIRVSGVGSPFDHASEAAADYVITAVTPTTISFNLTAANVTSTAVTSPLAIARPTGKDTFFGNFHKVLYNSDFIVPSNWILLALRNSDASTVEWATGDTVDPGYDSDSPVFKQVILNSTSDVNANAGNKPALRIGSITGSHLRIDGNEIQSMNSDSSAGALALNISGGAINLGVSGGGGVSCKMDLDVAGSFDNPGHPTGSFTANVNLTAAGRLRRDTSSRRYKENERIIELDPSQLLKLTPKAFQRNDHRDPATDELVGYREDNPWYYGFIAEDAQDLELLSWVVYDEQTGEVDGFAYDKWVVALQAVCQSQQNEIDELKALVKQLLERE